MTYTHLERVRILYKAILRLHRGLPKELSELGTKYAREEFKKHKKCKKEEAEIFINEWTNYAITLTKQLGVQGPRSGSSIGTDLHSHDLDKFKEDQLYQLYELMQASKGPQTA